MSYTTTTRLGLKKAVVGSNQAFETAVFNDNLDKVDADSVTQNTRLNSLDGSVSTLGSGLSSTNGAVSTLQGQVGALQTLTTSGTVNAATSAVTASNALKLDGRKLTVGASAPSSPTTGDLWIQV
jgi:hypothetical protein